MAEKTAQHIIGLLQKKWVAVTWFSNFLIALAGSFILSIALHKFFETLYWSSIPIFILIFLLLIFFDRSWKINEQDVARFLNNKYPELEESAALLLAPVSSLNFLQQLQVQKTGQSLIALHNPGNFYKKLKPALLTALTALIIGAGLSLLPNRPYKKEKPVQSTASDKPMKPEKLLPAISAVAVSIQPPLYTRKPARTQERLNLQAEEGANITWQIKTNVSIKNIQFIFNDSKAISLNPVNNERTLWSTHKIIDAPGFYQLKMDTIVSELYKMEMVKDLPPVIQVQTPKANTVIDYGEPEKVMLNLEVTDDYGIKDVSVAATISSGTGEGVKFEQRQINFDGSFASQLPKYQLKKLIDLASLGMKPGDELYFYIKAIDNNRQEKRSDIYIVSIADTAQLMTETGLMNGISVKPEYFRSERQIIIETEQLIKDKDKLSETDFKNRANNLGIDQKLLRLRYGKFLGEEDESNESEHEGTLGDLKDFGNAEKVLDAYTDKHDNAETADFFEIATKNQLKATLTEMWKAELRLRTFTPAEALPYEYKALRLLKDLQQKSRAYVAKTNYITAPLKPEKRLTADLSKILDPFRQNTIQQPAGKAEIVRTALSILEQLKIHQDLNINLLPILQQAGMQLADKAIAAPAVYLASLEALKRIIIAAQHNSVANVADISRAQNALQKMIDSPGNLPCPNKKAANVNLSKEYFNNLNKLKSP